MVSSAIRRLLSVLSLAPRVVQIFKPNYTSVDPCMYFACGASYILVIKLWLGNHIFVQVVPFALSAEKCGSLSTWCEQ